MTEWPATAVAVVGVGCRLPGGICSLDDLWVMLDKGQDVVREVPADRFDAAWFMFPGQQRPGKTYTVAGGFLEDIAGFDAAFFGISPKEAARLDPQQRLLLECAVEALDDAGIDPAGLAGSDTTVLIGTSSRDYGELQSQRLRTVSPYSVSGSASSNTANRLSYLFDLRGPSAAIDTACSSALTAVHQACEVLRSGHSALALAGGVNVLLNPAGYVGFSQASMLSPTGRCRPFSAQADGYARAEGAALVVLKPLGAALADGDRVHAVIAAHGVNADGRTMGLALPNAETQAALLEQVYATAGISPQEVAYVEAHGTGTQAGDPVECAALGQALGRHRGHAALPVGSVKSNLGHLEPASGMAGLLKALLVLRERWIPRTLHAEPVSEVIDFAGLGLEPVLTARPLTGSGRQVVGINSFGFGGANAHIVLAAAPPVPVHVPEEPRRLPVMVSAATPPALAEAAARWADHLDKTDRLSFYDTAFTACRRRGHHERRIVVLAVSCRDAAASLRALGAGEPVPGGMSAVAVRHGRVGFVFNGNGAQWVGMGSELLAADPACHAEIAAVDETLTPLLGWSVLDELTHPLDPGRWERTEVAQPLLFAMQAGLVAALAARGVAPAAVIGHSVGEVAAAYCAGALDRASACRVIARRSQAQAITAGAGRMAAVGMSSAEAHRELADLGFAGRLVVAGVNSPRDVTISGECQALAAFGAALQGRGVFVRDLELDYAFHSPAMARVHERLTAELSGLAPADCRTPMFSTVTGALVDGATLDAGYWWRNVREPVRFTDAVEALTSVGRCDVLLEIGPHPVLGSYLRRTVATRPHPVAVVATMTRTTAGPEALDTAQAHLLAAGAECDWEVFFPHRGHVVDAPAYPWQRERHWHGSPDWWLGISAEDTPAGQRHPLLGARQPGPEPAWQQEIDPAALAWLADHKVGQAVVFPAAGYVDIALAAGWEVFDGPVEITGLTISRALSLPFDDPAMDVRLYIILSRDGTVTVTSRSGERPEWVAHTRGRIRRLLRDRPSAVDVAALRCHLPGVHTAQEHYAACARAGLPYGPAFQTVIRLQAGDGEVLADYTATIEFSDTHLAHPTVLDGALQAGLPLVAAVTDEQVPFLPSGIDAVRCWQPMPTTGLVHLRARTVTTQEALWDLLVTDLDGVVALELRGCRLHRFDAARRASPTQLREVLRAAPLPATPARPAPPLAPRDILDTCAGELRTLTEQWHAYRYAQYQPRILELAAHFTAAAFQELLPAQDIITINHFLAAGVAAKHLPLLRALTGLATQHGTLTAVGPGHWRLATDPIPQQLFQALLRETPGESTVVHLFGVCGRHLAAVLSGAQDPLELLFSETDTVAAHFYNSAPVMQYHHQVAQRLLRTIVTAWPTDRPLRVLEVGAGTGGLTATLLPHLPPERTRYTYTDISPAFFPAARQRFAAFDFLDYQPLDLEAEPLGQGFDLGSCDVVIAANVLHATADLARTIHRIAGLLADGGHLLIVESHNQQLAALTFGLLDSFWVATDTERRPDGPLLEREKWPPLLAEGGFTATVQTGDPAEPARSDYSVILATRDPRAAPASHAQRPAPDGDSTRRWLVTSLQGGGQAPELPCQVVTALRAHTGPGAVRNVSAGEDAAQWATLLTQDPRPVNIVLLTGNSGTPGTAAPAAVTEQAVRHCAVLRALATACEERADHREPTVWIVTSGTEERGCCPPAAPGAGAALWGAARSLANEQPRLVIRRIALTQPSGREDTAALIDRLVQEMLARPPDDEVVLTPSGRFVSRVRPLVPACRPSTGSALSAYALTLDNPGLRYRLGWRAATVPTPRPGEVVLSVAAAALNYRDIMIATGLIPASVGRRRPDVPDIGFDCAGTVTAVGPDVTHLSPGDRVACVSLGGLGSYAIARADRIMPIPAGMTFPEAATLPTAFLTVQHSLHHLARLAAGETILIHSAAGGVGLAALQYARHVGARVIATAGTPAKRDLLCLLGVQHVLNSRSLHFADQIADLTGGEGVDVVLNSLAGEALVRSLGVLKPHGRFLELGKRDFLADNTLPLAPFLHNLAFFGVDVSTLLGTSSPMADEHLAAVREHVRGGAYWPLPHRTYPAALIHEAFACLQHSRHTGKVVITFEDPVSVSGPVRGDALDPNAIYLITGGLGGFGAATARHLVARGARHLVLISRRGRHAPEAPSLLADLRSQGAQVRTHAADAADAATMRSIFEAIDATGRRLAGVIHAAMVLDDAPLTELTDERIRAVLTPKVTAGYLLDDLTHHRHLDHFIVYSSSSALTGNIRQASYVAANLALEAMVRARRRAGLPGLAIRWGAIADVGYIHRTQRTGEMQSLGWDSMPATDALTALDELLDRTDADVITVGNFDWGAIARFNHNLAAPRTAALLPARKDTDSAEQLRSTLAETTTDNALILVQDALAGLLASILQTTPERIDHSRRLDQLGMDSLMTAELATLVQRRFGCQLPTVELIGATSLTSITHRILTHLGQASHPAS
jgi:acyl transferase domain-containing protein/NADPH:quinone reductase-like Zn-dependent oxidoreductase/NADP-dependent 3-hydroxy acid dehydrogenase YdfG/acyl carrier protein